MNEDLSGKKNSGSLVDRAHRENKTHPPSKKYGKIILKGWKKNCARRGRLKKKMGVLAVKTSTAVLLVLTIASAHISVAEPLPRGVSRASKLYLLSPFS